MIEGSVEIDPQEQYARKLFMDLFYTYTCICVLVGLYGGVCALWFPMHIAHVSSNVWFAVFPGIFGLLVVSLEG